MAPRTRTVPRKSPRQPRSRATVDAILDATARVLTKEGFDRASTNRIAEVAGVSVGSLYQYFPSKEALVAALVDRHASAMEAVIADAAGELLLLPPVEAARRMVAAMLRAHAVDPTLHKVLHEQVPRIGRNKRIYEIEMLGLSLTRAYLEAHRHEIRRVDLDTAAFLIVASVEAMTHAAVLYQPERLDDHALHEEIATMVVAYLR